jgi:hypothetical protein
VEVVVVTIKIIKGIIVKCPQRVRRGDLPVLVALEGMIQIIRMVVM